MNATGYSAVHRIIDKRVKSRSGELQRRALLLSGRIPDSPDRDFARSSIILWTTVR